MKVCVVGHFKDSIDEGVRIVAKTQARELENAGFEVKKIDISSFSKWKKINDFRPDIIHFVLCPTLRGIMISKLLSIFNLNAKTIISAIQPSIPNTRLLKLFKIDLVFVQSEESEKIFNSLGFKTIFLPNGVDINKFNSVNDATRQRLREKYGIPLDKFVLLHLASLKKERNLEIFKEIQKQSGNQVLIIGRENESLDEQVISALEEAGCIVWIKHFSNIEEIYNLSDCYVFPTRDKRAAIEMPLSVLEAMASNLPVITSRFGALPRAFDGGDGLFFVDNENEIHKVIEIVKNGAVKVYTRDKVLPYSWKNLIKKSKKVYEEIIS